MRLKIMILITIFFLFIPISGFAQKSKSKKIENPSTNKQFSKKKNFTQTQENKAVKELTEQPSNNSPKQENTVESNNAASTPDVQADKPSPTKKKVFENSDIEAHGLAPEVKAASQPQNNNSNNDNDYSTPKFDSNGYIRKDGTYVTPRIGRGRVPTKK